MKDYFVYLPKNPANSIRGCVAMAVGYTNKVLPKVLRKRFVARAQPVQQMADDFGRNAFDFTINGNGHQSLKAYQSYRYFRIFYPDCY
jgi:hypothetical protein